MKANYDPQRNRRPRIVCLPFILCALLTKAGATKGPKSSKKKKQAMAEMASTTGYSKSEPFVVDEVGTSGHTIIENGGEEADQVSGTKTEKRKNETDKVKKNRKKQKKKVVVHEDEAAEEVEAVAILTGNTIKKRKKGKGKEVEKEKKKKKVLATVTHPQ